MKEIPKRLNWPSEVQSVRCKQPRSVQGPSFHRGVHDLSELALVLLVYYFHLSRTFSLVLSSFFRWQLPSVNLPKGWTRLSAMVWYQTAPDSSSDYPGFFKDHTCGTDKQGLTHIQGVWSTLCNRVHYATILIKLGSVRTNLNHIYMDNNNSVLRWIQLSYSNSQNF